MKPVTAVVEVLFLALFLATIAAICMVSRLAVETAIVALILGGVSYAITTFVSSPYSEETDKHVKLG